jgi:cell division cycle protein 20 (cofactor of APC complex)
VRFTDDGQHLAVGKSNGAIEVWDTVSGEGVRRMSGHEDRVYSLGWNPQLLLASGDALGRVRINDLRMRDPLRTEMQMHQQTVCGLRWNNDGTAFASGGNDNRVMIFDLAQQRVTQQLTEHCAAVKALAWCPWQKDLLATGGGTADRHIRFWNAGTGAMLNSIDTQSQVSSLLWSPDASCKELISGHGFSKNQLSVWKYPSMVKVAELTGHEDRILHMALSPDGQRVASVAADESLRLWKVFEPLTKPACGSIASTAAAQQQLSKKSYQLIR